MPRIVSQNNSGFTLLELMISIVILIVGLLTLIYLSSRVMERNLQNVLRDESVRIAEQKLSDLKARAFTANDAEAGLAAICSNETRNVRSGAMTYAQCYEIARLSESSLQLRVHVGWNYKGSGSLAPTNKQYQTSLVSLIGR